MSWMFFYDQRLAEETIDLTCCLSLTSISFRERSVTTSQYADAERFNDKLVNHTLM